MHVTVEALCVDNPYTIRGRKDAAETGEIVVGSIWVSSSSCYRLLSVKVMQRIVLL